MKRNLLLMMLGLLSLSSCSKTEGDEIAPTPENVEFTVNFGFAESGSMSRSGASAYDDFYTKYIKTKELTPDTYRLTFKQGDNIFASVNGTWGASDIITLPAGTYTVTGTSESSTNFSSDIAKLAFNQDVEITKTTTNINLTAEYDCLLLLLNGNNISSPSFVKDGYGGSTDLYSKDNLYYIFFAPSEYYYFDSGDYIYYTGSQTGTSRLYLRNLNLEKGNYYYYDLATGSFDIPPMNAGN